MLSVIASSCPLPRPRRALSAALGCTLLLTGCAASGGDGACDGAASTLCGYDLNAPAARWRLPAALDEASGLAAVAADALLTHNDNDAALWRLSASDPFEARRVSDPALVIDGDFEGVAVSGSQLFALSSRGLVYRTRVTSGAPGPLVAMPTGVEGECNFEGIAAAPGRVLYLACKYPRRPRAGWIRLYRLTYRSGGDGVASVDTLEIDVGGVLDAVGQSRLRPSGLTWHSARSRLLVLAGKERVLLDIDPEAPRLVAWRPLAKRLHRQAEGVSLLPGGALAIVDEADGWRGTLTIYRPAVR